MALYCFFTNGSTCLAQKFSKVREVLFWNIQNIRFWLQDILKLFCLNVTYNKISIKEAFKAFSCFPRKYSQINHSKIYKKKTKSHFQMFRTLVLP